MNSKKGNYKVSGMMILAVIIVFAVLAVVTFAFEMLQKHQEKLISTAKNISQNETTMEIRYETGESQESGDNESDTDAMEILDVENVAQMEEYILESSLTEEAVDSEVEEADIVYLIKGDSRGSTKYARVDRLSYTDSVKYTEEQLACLDTYGLRVTRNEIYARHGRMFNDQELQEYFTNQPWYVPQSASGDFNEDCLNEVEKYNSDLIRSFELKQWN